MSASWTDRQANLRQTWARSGRLAPRVGTSANYPCRPFRRDSSCRPFSYSDQANRGFGTSNLNKQTFVHEAAIQSELSQWTLLLRRDGRRCCLAPIGWTLPSVSAAETLLHLGSSRRPALCYCAVVSGTGTGSDLAGKAAGGRKLIAVVYADMAGYSRLIALDDAGTLQRLRCLRRTLLTSR
jgi:hypothetical protein